MSRPAARPALILSPKAYNQRSGLALACSVTTHVKGYPFEVAVPQGCGVEGVILADHVKSLDWKARRAARISRVPASMLDEVFARLSPLLGG